ncbi:MAG: hypothetical protein KGV50_03485 [Gammaproteobacteria bacterium]|nr:hypothetical protein [Gammaproteobacteria bacterium]
MTSQKKAIILFIASLICIAIVIISSSRIGFDYAKKEEPPQNTEWSLSSQQTANLSAIEILPSTTKANIYVSFVIEERDSIKVSHDDCRRECNRYFDISKLQSTISDKTLRLDFSNTATDSSLQIVTITLPSRDWGITCLPKQEQEFECKEFSNYTVPINLEWISNDDIAIIGKYKQLDIWQVDSSGYAEITARKLQAESLDVYGKEFDINFINSNIEHINLHSSKDSSFDTDNLMLIQRTKWQRLSQKEQNRLDALHPTPDKIIKDKQADCL